MHTLSMRRASQGGPRELQVSLLPRVRRVSMCSENRKQAIEEEDGPGARGAEPATPHQAYKVSQGAVQGGQMPGQEAFMYLGLGS